VASLRTLAAASTTPDRNAQTALVRENLDDLLLVLIGLALELKIPAAARARRGQRDPDLLIDTLRWRPVRLGAVALAALAPRPRRVLLGGALRKRRRLTLAGTPSLLQLAAQPGDLRTQPIVLRPQPRPTTMTPRPDTTMTRPASSTHPAQATTTHARNIPCKQKEPCPSPRRPAANSRPR
jgi:hypothetical protein